MSEPVVYTEAGWHKQQAVDCFNAVWTYLENPQRTPEEDDAMIHLAHASRHHWAQIGTAVNLVRGEWQIARVYAVLERVEPALYHARRCLELCMANGIGDFDLAYAYEALARAYAVAGDREQRDQWMEQALQAGAVIADADDRELFRHDLATIP